MAIIATRFSYNASYARFIKMYEREYEYIQAFLPRDAMLARY